MVVVTYLSQTNVVTNAAEAIPRYSATVSQLDILELVRAGAMAAYPLGADEGTVEFALTLVPESAPGLLDLTDLEGVPVARVRVDHSPERWSTCGAPQWLGPRSTRPFDHLHRRPGEFPERTGVVALQGTDVPEAAHKAVTDAGPRPLVLALASLDGDTNPTAVATARLARDLAAAHPGAMVAVAPVPPSFSPAERDAVVRAYARKLPVTVLGGEPAETADAGTVVFFTGLSGSGKSTLARAIRNRLIEDGQRVTLLDGDVVRRHLSSGLGFSAADRDTNIRRIGWVAAEIAHHGGVAICSPIAPFDTTRQAVRRMAEQRGARFVLVHVATPLSECERRDRKGLYARARRGEIPEFTGISSPYEAPDSPDLQVDTTSRDVEPLVDEILAHLGGQARAG